MKKHFQPTKPTGLLSVIAVDLIYLSLSETINSRFDGIEEGLSAAEKKEGPHHCRPSTSQDENHSEIERFSAELLPFRPG